MDNIPATMDLDRYDVGIYYDIPEHIYHADCAIEPSLSAGVAKTMLESTPQRASWSHPRLNPTLEPFKPTAAMDEGSVLHRLILGSGPRIVPVKAKDWRTDAAKMARDQAHQSGAVPILVERLGELEAIADAARAMLEQSDDDRQILSDDYASEVTMIWREQTGAMCRARADRLHRTDPSAPIYDLKFTDKLDSPLKWDRSIFDNYWDMRAAFYARGASHLRDGVLPPYRFAVFEKKIPCDMMVYELTDSFMDEGEKKATMAIYAWECCRRANRFPSYPRRTFYIQEPGWAESSWKQRAHLVQSMLPERIEPAVAGPEQGSMLDFIRGSTDLLAEGEL